jgi:CRISPR/Cas system-associated exonuclease Cas4 (RecB family)
MTNTDNSILTADELYRLIVDNIKISSTRGNDFSVLNASLLYNICPRGCHLIYNNKLLVHQQEKSIDDSLKLVFKLGWKIEEIINEALLQYHVNVPLLSYKIGNFTIKGHPDIIIENNGNVYILEIKSMSLEQFKQLKQPIYKHEHQLLTYLLLAKKNKLKVTQGFLVYVSKGHWKPPIKIYPMSLNKTFEQQFKQFAKGLCSNTMPDRTCATQVHASLTNCPVKDLCFAV